MFPQISDDLLRQVASGRHIRVVRRNNSRVISVLNRRRAVVDSHTLSADDYDEVMRTFVDELVKRASDSFKVRVVIDFYGTQVAEVRAGLFGRNRARIGLSPRHLSRLEDGLTRKQLQPEPA